MGSSPISATNPDQQVGNWPVGQAVKTRPFHGCNMGSIPVRVTTSSSIRTLMILTDLLFMLNNQRTGTHVSVLSAYSVRLLTHDLTGGVPRFYVVPGISEDFSGLPECSHAAVLTFSPECDIILSSAGVKFRLGAE